jgi:hypothetical protein
MTLFRSPAVLTVLVAATLSAAVAQPTPSPAPPTAYRSAFDDYKRHRDEPLIPWRQANDAVGRIGGWRAYAREAQGTPPPEAAASTPGRGDKAP